ncbi:MAG: hypothetical protein JO154_13055 [Chitinophaga sp.]|uniref:hypothetical protein n=1 Tax=Chitinophaga sp. TaxID=1869181 RepID=UPI0025C65F62|nr:hypothetical protein [Chitinophaga sp.]MBV8253528.1 hypothetical protein [Chitinophaga sp.]
MRILFPYLMLVLLLPLISTAQTIQIKNGLSNLQSSSENEYEVSITILTQGKLQDTTSSVILKAIPQLPGIIKLLPSKDVQLTPDSQAVKINLTPSDFPGNNDLQPKSIRKTVTFKSYPADDTQDVLPIKFILQNSTGNIKINNIDNEPFIVVAEKIKDSQSRANGERVDIYYLNAYNFGFGQSLKSNYLGRFNVFVKSIEDSNWGLNLGFTTINYNIGDSDSTSSYFKQLVSPDPLLDKIPAGTKYASQLSKFVTKRQNSSQSLFIQPMYRILKVGTKFNFYAHAHLELLINKTSLTTTVNVLNVDSIVAPGNLNVDSAFFRFQPSNYSRSYTFLNGYFGGGITLDYSPLNNLKIFSQFTFGGTTNYPNTFSINDQNSVTLMPPSVLNIYPPTSGRLGPGQSEPTRDTKPNTKSSWFYYIHGFVSYNVTSAIQGLIGAEIRGLLPNYSPYYAVYAGVNVDLKSLFTSLK